jgi:lauroyl/myristoyl acyltransferase
MTDFGYRLAALLSRRLPRRVSDPLAAWCADVYVATHPGRARAVRGNLLRAGVASPDPRETYRAFACAVRDFLAGASTAGATRVELDPDARRALALARASGEPTLLVSGHFGPWERALQWIATELGGVDALALPHRSPAVERFFVERRAAAGVRTLRCDRPALAALELLRAGSWIAALVDRTTGPAAQDGLVPIDRGPLLLARRARALVLPGVSWIDREDVLHVRFDAPFSLDPRRGGLPVSQAAARLQTFFDAHVREHPTQWFDWAAGGAWGAAA